MNRLISYVAAVVLVAMLSGCSAATKTIMSKSQSERTDSFKEVTASEALPAGYADVIIRANIKTPGEGYYIGESKKAAHGKSDYPFLINIDGQAALWKVEGEKHMLPEEPYSSVTEMSLKDGGQYVLESRPDYRHKTLPTRIPTFVKGISSYKVVVSEMAVH
jgi:hypothetical protein